MPTSLIGKLVHGPAPARWDAWRKLTLHGELEKRCRKQILEAPANPNAVTKLEEAWRRFDRERGSVSALLARPFGNSIPPNGPEIARMIGQVGLLLAAAVLAARVRRDETDECSMSDWARRASDLTDDARGGTDADPAVEGPLAIAFRGLRAAAEGQGRLRQLAAARDAALTFLGSRRRDHWIDSVPILTLIDHPDREDAEGRVIYLSLARLPDGSGAVFPLPTLFRTFDEEWRSAFEEAVRRESPRLCGIDVSWTIQVPPAPRPRNRSTRGGAVQAAASGIRKAAKEPASDDWAPLSGRSAQAAFQVALRLIAVGRPYDPRYAVSARVNDAGGLEEVRGLVVTHGKAGPKLVAARDSEKVRTVFMAPGDYWSLAEEVRRGLGDDLEVRRADRIDDVYTAVAGQLHLLADYLQQMERLPEKGYVEQDVECRSPDGTGHESPWHEELADWVRASTCRHGLLVGAPGQGKTTLAQVTASKFATAAREAINDGRPLDRIGWPALVALNRLTGDWLGEVQFEANPVERLRRALGRIVEFGSECDVSAASFAAKDLIECIVPADEQAKRLSPGLLILDALDEVAEAHRPAARAILRVVAGLKCHVLVTSRPHAVEERPEGGWTTYTLLPLFGASLDRFLEQWQEPVRTRLRDLAVEGPGGDVFARTPFLLKMTGKILEESGGDPRLGHGRLLDRIVRRMVQQALRKLVGSEDGLESWLHLLEGLALVAFEAEGERGAPLSREEVLNLLRGRRELPALRVPVDDPATGVLEVLENGRLFARQDNGGGYGAIHRLVLESLAARGLRDELVARSGWSPRRWWRIRRAWRQLDRRSWECSWEQVILFLAEALPSGEAGRLIAWLADARRDDRFGHRLALAVRCLAARIPDDPGPAQERVAAGAFRLWWAHALVGTGAVVEHLAASLPAVARLEPAVEGQTLNDWLEDRLVDRDARVRLLAVQCIGLMGGGRGELLYRLVDRLIERPTELAEEVADAFRRFARTVGEPQVMRRLAYRLLGLVGDYREEVRVAGATALRALGPSAVDETFSAELTGRLMDVSGAGVLQAVRVAGALGRAATEEIIKELRGLSETKAGAGVSLRAAAVQALGELGPYHPDMKKGFLNKLSGLLGDDCSTVRAAAILAVRAVGQEDVPEKTLNKIVSRMLESRHDEEWRVAAAVFAVIGLGTDGDGPKRRRQIVRHLAACWNDSSTAESQLLGADMAGHLGAAVADPSLVTTLANYLKSNVEGVRRAAVFALDRMSPTPTARTLPLLLDPLLELLAARANVRLDVKAAAARVVGKMVRATGEPGPVRIAPEQALNTLSDDQAQRRAAAARTRLVGWLHAARRSRHDLARRVLAASVIGHLGPPSQSFRLSRELLRMLDDDHPSVVAAAWEAVAARGDWRDEPERRKGFFRVLARHLRTAKPEVRLAAASAAAELAPDLSRVDVLAALYDLVEAYPDPAVRSAAAEALRQWMSAGARLFDRRWAWLRFGGRRTLIVRTVQQLGRLGLAQEKRDKGR
jgi:hypothetical protein